MSTLSKSDLQFHEELCTEDELGSVIRAHLHIEQKLNELLKGLIPYAEEIDPLNLDFYSRVHLALAMGLKKEYKNPLLNLGAIRNRLAHKKGYELSKSDANNFYKSFSEADKIIIQQGCNGLQSIDKKWAELQPRDHFILCVIVLDNVLLFTIDECKSGA